MKLHNYQFREIGGMVSRSWSRPILALNVYRAYKEYCQMNGRNVESWNEGKKNHEVLKND